MIHSQFLYMFEIFSFNFKDWGCMEVPREGKPREYVSKSQMKKGFRKEELSAVKIMHIGQVR